MDIKVKKRLLWAILFSILFLVFLLTRVEWTHFSMIAESLDSRWLIAAYCVFLLGNLVRAFRFIQLDHTGNNLAHWWNANAFYNFMTATLPGGAGEAATAYGLKKYSLLNMTGAFRILLIGRFMDVSALSILFFLAAISISSSTPYREVAIWLTGILFFMTLIALIPASERFLVKCLERLPVKVLFIEKISKKLNELLEIVKERQSVKIYFFTSIQSLLSILAGVLTLQLLLRSLGIYFTPVQSIYCYGVYAIFQMVPVQGVAGIGTQAAWWALALNVAGYDAPNAIALGFILYGLFYLFIASMGALSVLGWFRAGKNN
jgi:hypothetical protein